MHSEPFADIGYDCERYATQSPANANTNTNEYVRLLLGKNSYLFVA